MKRKEMAFDMLKTLVGTVPNDQAADSRVLSIMAMNIVDTFENCYSNRKSVEAELKYEAIQLAQKHSTPETAAQEAQKGSSLTEEPKSVPSPSTNP